MLCTKCQKNHANIQLHLNMNGHNQTLHLCSECYAIEKEKLHASMQGPSGFEDLFKGFSMPENQFNKVKTKTSNRKNGFLDQFGRNLNDAANAGLIDPVIGREKEIERV